MKTLTKTILAVLVTGVLSCGLVQADPIQGSISFTGGVTYDTGNVNTATTVTEWFDTEVLSSTGDFLAAGNVNGTAATFTDPWQFNPSVAVASLWSLTLGGFSFDLTSCTVDFQAGGFLLISGVGTIHGTGFDDTAGTWSFSSNDPSSGGVFSFSAGTAAIPDGGSAVALLGVALAGVEVLRRKFARK